MDILVTIATLFVIGSTLGWVLELFYRRFISQHKWMNPGFLVGPYLPIYGFGVVALFGIARLGNYLSKFVPTPWGIVIEIVLITIAMTLVEYIAGLIFIKGMGIKLWDYSNQWGNIQGIICPLYTVFWAIGGALYLFLLDPLLIDALIKLSQNLVYCFFIGIVVGMVIVDTAYSLHLGVKLSKVAKENKLLIKLDEFKKYVKEKHKNVKSNTFAVTILSHDKAELKEIIEEWLKH